MDTIKYEDAAQNGSNMISMGQYYEGGKKDKQDGDMSEDYDYGEQEEGSLYIQQP